MPIADWIWRNSKVGIDSNCDEAGKNDPDCRAEGRSEYTEGQVIMKGKSFPAVEIGLTDLPTKLFCVTCHGNNAASNAT